MSKGYILLILLYVSALFIFMTDFFYQDDWMTWYIQFGPLILTLIIILIAAAFEKKDDESKANNKKSKESWLVFILLSWLLIIFMNIFVGEPNMDVLNIHNPEFWILVVVLPLLSQFNYKKRTDGT